MLYEFIYYVIPKEELNTEEIPILVEWEIDHVPAGYPSSHDPLEEATTPEPHVTEINIFEAVKENYTAKLWKTITTYIKKHDEEIIKEVQDSTALMEAFNDVVDPEIDYRVSA